jgi:hypothetical protein
LECLQGTRVAGAEANFLLVLTPLVALRWLPALLHIEDDYGPIDKSNAGGIHSG